MAEYSHIMEEIQQIINKLLYIRERVQKIAKDPGLSQTYRDKQVEAASYLTDMLPDLAEVFGFKICEHCEQAELRQEFTARRCNKCNNEIEQMRQTASDGFDWYKRQ